MFGLRGLRAPAVGLDLAEVSEIPLGKGVIRVVATPGHTPGGVTFLMGERGATGLFGDSLFHLSVGRTDLAATRACTPARSGRSSSRLPEGRRSTAATVPPPPSGSSGASILS